MPVSAAAVAASVAAAERVLVVLDDDPTGTQSVSDIPVLTRWEEEDFCWAFTHLVGTRPAPAVYVLTNTRGLEPVEAAARNREVITNALAAAVQTGSTLGFVSRSDSTLRGHYPLEPDVIAATLKEVAGQRTDGVVIVPAFPDAGRITIGGVHYMRNGGTLIPGAETEFAKDASFGFRNSELARYVEEKSSGRFKAADVIVLDLNIIRGGADLIAGAVAGATDSSRSWSMLSPRMTFAPWPWAWRKLNHAERRCSTGWAPRLSGPASAKKSARRCRVMRSLQGPALPHTAA